MDIEASPERLANGHTGTTFLQLVLVTRSRATNGSGFSATER
jgi:hypothetical protein